MFLRGFVELSGEVCDHSRFLCAFFLLLQFRMIDLQNC
jgi:hypothetical protein